MNSQVEYMLEPIQIGGVLILSQSTRIIAKYFDEKLKTMRPSQVKNFEAKLFSKTEYSTNEEPNIMTFEGFTVVYKAYREVRIMIISSPQESDLISATVLSTLDRTLSTLLERHMSERVMLNNLDMIGLAVDELTDQGLVIETDPTEIIRKINIRSDSVSDHLNMDSMEHTLSSALSLAKDQFLRSLRS